MKINNLNFKLKKIQMLQNTLCKSDNLPKLSILTTSLKSLSFSHRIQTLQPIYSTNIFPSNTQSPHKQPTKNFLNKNPSTLFTAIEFNNLIQTKNLLLNSNLEINTFNDEGITPLHIAVIKGNINKLKHIKKHPMPNNEINAVIFFSTSTFDIIACAILSLQVFGR